MSDLRVAGGPVPISLRPISEADVPFLYEVYASTRQEELSPLPWHPSDKAAFLKMQFEAQHRYYQEHYDNAAFEIVFRNGRPIGRLYVARWRDEIRIMDIALLPQNRGAGIGTYLLSALQDEAVRTGKPLRIHVERFNQALGLYERLGFQVVEDRGVYLFLEWRPVPRPPGAV